MSRHLIVIGGPTASGKTALSIQFAEHFQTEIISADSRQCYKEMSIGTAKPNAEELTLVPHHFINSHSVAEVFNAGAFAEAAHAIIEKLFETKEVVVVVGGSGLYLKALLDGIDDLPAVAPEIRIALKAAYKAQGLAPLLNELEQKDPLYFTQTDRKNHQRILRALEIIRASNQSYSSFLGKKKNRPSYTTTCVAIEFPRAELYQRIDKRVLNMMEDGLEEEVRSLLPYRNHPAMRTVGYNELFDYFDGNLSLQDAVRLIQQHSRNYAKRQMTWFKNQGDYTFYNPTEIFSEVIKSLSVKP